MKFEKVNTEGILCDIIENKNIKSNNNKHDTELNQIYEFGTLYDQFILTEDTIDSSLKENNNLATHKK